MKIRHLVPSKALFALAVLALLGAQTCLADSFVQTNLVSDIPGLAYVTDPNLKNPWGVSFSATSPFWISNQGSGTSTLYNGAGTPTALVVSVPGGGTPSGPTGQVFNSSSGFVLANGKPASFIFDTLNGTIAAWNNTVVGGAAQVVSTPGAIYTGLAINTSGSATYLYAADSTGKVQAFNSNFQAVTLAGNFADPHAIAGYTPFNIQSIGSSLYVTYAQLTPQGAALPGGYIDVFNTDGTFAKRLSTGGPLDAPWGITLAPVGFDSLGGDLLVGNFGNGEILAYDPTTGAYLSTLSDANGNPIVNDNLWALDFRTGGTSVNTEALYITAGINNQQDGLFAQITATPEPSELILILSGLSALLVQRRTRETRSTQSCRPTSPKM